jgi:serpin B
MNRREFCLASGNAILGLAMFNTGMSLKSVAAAPAGNAATFANAINALGLDLLANASKAGDNALLSPFSIQAAFAMTWAGADGVTRQEMAKVLHYPDDASELQSSYQALQKSLDDIAKSSAARAEQSMKSGIPASDPITLAVANRLFGQRGYAFRPPFLDVTKTVFDAPFEIVNFNEDASAARKTINVWVEERTNQRIKDLIPPDGISRETRLVLVNAIFLKAPWHQPFSAAATKPAPFRLAGGGEVEVSMMQKKSSFGYAREEGFTAVTIPYAEGELQFLVLLPDTDVGLPALESKVKPELLTRIGNAESREVNLFLPKFRIEPPLVKLSTSLKALGMRTAFDVPPGSANFDRMAPRLPNDYLYISEAFHKTFLSLDEKGTEAAAATAVAMARATSAMINKPQPVEVRVDRPFLFAVQHRASGCLFLGRLNTPNREGASSDEALAERPQSVFEEVTAFVHGVQCKSGTFTDEDGFWRTVDCLIRALIRQ